MIYIKAFSADATQYRAMFTNTTIAQQAQDCGSIGLVAVVDDDDAVRESLRFLLEIAGYGVATYASAVEFLQEAPPGELTCLVVDQQMPELTGLEMVARLRTQGVSVPMALITGSLSSEVTLRARELSLDLVLEKPLDDDKLLDFVAKSAVA